MRIFWFLLLPWVLSASSIDPMLEHLSVVKSYFNVRYAPKEWKAAWSGWDLDREILRVEERLLSIDSLSPRDYQTLIKGFFNSTHDYHVAVSFYSTEYAGLPFTVKGIGNKYYITSIDPYEFPLEQFPIEIGDQLLAIDGRDVDEIITELVQNEFPQSNSETDRSLAEKMLTCRMGLTGVHVPKGAVTIKVRSQGTSQERSYQLVWDYFPNEVTDYYLAQSPLKIPRYRDPSYRKCQMQIMTPESELSVWKPELSQKLFKNLQHPNEIGVRRGFLPRLGKVTWESWEFNPFDAYLYEHPSGKTVGYIRIPHFSFGEKEAYFFAELIETMEEKADALVIDQMNNNGGNAFFLYAILSMLTDDPLKTPKHRMTIASEDVWDALLSLKELSQITDSIEARELIGETLDGYPVNFQTVKFIEGFYRFIIEEWKAGKTLTDPYYIWGVDSINPHPSSRYTKPILVLINGLDFSCADFFPAILQDNHRAAIIGTPTAGAGGYIDVNYFPNVFGISFMRLTASIAERMNHQPIENLGVTPDIPLELTEEDLNGNYIHYTNVINQAIDSLIGEQ